MSSWQVQQKIERHIKNEISIMRSINHPNIVNLQDVFYSSHNLYLVLELAKGGNARSGHTAVCCKSLSF